MPIAAIEPKVFRQVLGQYPTGVCVVTAAVEGQLVGMTIGSFTSVSLDPPLVAFLPDRVSSTWAQIRQSGNFCVNILAAGQEWICRQFASRSEDKFQGVDIRLSDSGSPVIKDCVAWIDCAVEAAQDAGDHCIVIGRVRELQIEKGGLPLLFFQGGYGQFTPLSFAAADPLGSMTAQLRYVDLARPTMERLAQDLSSRCIAIVRTGGELVFAASAGEVRGNSSATMVGQRLPFVPPVGLALAAWSPPEVAQAWLSRAGSDAARARLGRLIHAVRERGYSVSLISEVRRAFSSALNQLAARDTPVVDLWELIEDLYNEPEEITPEILKKVRLISAPVLGPDGHLALLLTVYEFGKPEGEAGIIRHINRLRQATGELSGLVASKT